MARDSKTIAVNKKARHDYAIVETFETGIVLTGTDLKGYGGMATVVLAAGPVLTLTFYRMLAPRAKPVRRPAAAVASAA